MRSSPKLMVSVALLVTLVTFQNCSETLPEQQTEKSSNSTSPGPSPAPGPVPAISLSSASAGPTAILPGGAISLSTKVSSNMDLTNVVLRLSVKNASQTVVWSQNFPNQTVLAAQLKDFVQSFLAPETLTPGFYSVSAEILSPDLNQNLFTANNATTFEVKPPIRVSVGNTMPYTDSLGRVWSADTGITGMSIPTTEPLASVQGSNDPALYSSFRWGQDPVTGASAAFSFTAIVPSNGKYKVTLKWVEHYVFGPNLRIFSVVINGTTVLQDFDLFVAAGGAFIAYDRSFVVTTGQATPQVRVTFNPGIIENPKINAIEILGAP